MHFLQIFFMSNQELQILVLFWFQFCWFIIRRYHWFLFDIRGVFRALFNSLGTWSDDMYCRISSRLRSPSLRWLCIRQKARLLPSLFHPIKSPFESAKTERMFLNNISRLLDRQIRRRLYVHRWVMLNNEIIMFQNMCYNMFILLYIMLILY